MNRSHLMGVAEGYGYGARLRFDQLVDTRPKDVIEAERRQREALDWWGGAAFMAKAQAVFEGGNLALRTGDTLTIGGFTVTVD